MLIILTTWTTWITGPPEPPDQWPPQYSPVQSSTAQYNPVQPTTAKYSPVKLSTAQNSQVQPSTAKYSPVQLSTAKYSPLQPSRAQYSPVQSITPNCSSVQPSCSPEHPSTASHPCQHCQICYPMFPFRNRIVYFVLFLLFFRDRGGQSLQTDLLISATQQRNMPRLIFNISLGIKHFSLNFHFLCSCLLSLAWSTQGAWLHHLEGKKKYC